MIKYSETPIEIIDIAALNQAGVKLLVKREDLNHPEVSGNKWWKLKYNLEEAMKLKHKTLLTFGGSYSNHIFSTAAAAQELGLKSIGIIRGEETLPLNQTLSFARKKGMLLQFISRENYRRKGENDFLDDLRKSFGDFYLIPEGGTNALAVKGCAEFASEILSKINFDYMCLPVGTGGTMAGIVSGLGRDKQLIGFSALRGGAFLVEEVSRLLKSESPGQDKNWTINPDYHFGGYAKRTNQLDDFILNYPIPLDPVYTGKMMFGIHDLIEKGYFRKGSNILALHTGGLQATHLGRE